jgi:hypothetical protein
MNMASRHQNFNCGRVLIWTFVGRMRRMQHSAEVQAPADMRFFDLSQIGFFGFGSNSRKTLAADRIDGSITIASVREEGTGRIGHCRPPFMLLSVLMLISLEPHTNGTKAVQSPQFRIQALYAKGRLL